MPEWIALRDIRRTDIFTLIRPLLTRSDGRYFRFREKVRYSPRHHCSRDLIEQLRVFRIIIGIPRSRSIKEQITEGDKVASRFGWTGTHQEEFLGVPSSGRRVRIRGLVIDRLEKGGTRDVRIIMDPRADDATRRPSYASGITLFSVAVSYSWGRPALMKTELAKAPAGFMFHDEKAMFRVDVFNAMLQNYERRTVRDARWTSKTP